MFNQIRLQVEKHLPAHQPLVVAMDDSLLRKTGRHIHGVRWQRDPMSPPFHVNFVRGLRVLQVSAALPQGPGVARMVPIDFQHAVLPPKPPKQATEEELKRYKEQRAQKNINCVGQKRLESLREQMDRDGSAQRRLVMAVDGRFTNKTFLKQTPQRTVIIGRIRKDAVLHALPEPSGGVGRKRKYGIRLSTPEALLKDQMIPFQSVRAWAAGKEHAFQVKEMGPVVMRLNRGAQAVRIMVIKPLGYRLKKAGKQVYRQPAFLMCTDPGMSLEDFLQDFLWRWDIEVNFRDEKTLLGVGQAQVRTEASSQKVPAMAVAAYSLLLLASIQAYGKTGSPQRCQQAKWYQRKKEDRASTNELINQLRRDLWFDAISPAHLSDFLSPGSSDRNPQKPPVSLASAAFLNMN